ncbi:MAG: DUF362 domain-containing protein [Armatimonadota bacterium]
MDKKVTRREFLKGVAVTGIGVYGATLLPLNVLAAGKSAASKSKVIIANSPNVLVDAESNKNILSAMKMASVGQVNPAVDQVVLNNMVSQGMRGLTGAKTDAAAWKKFFKPTDVVGIKVNCIAGRNLSTHPELVASIIAGLKLAGVKEENIIVWDRTDREMIVAGYKLNRDAMGVKCYGTEKEYDAEQSKQGEFAGRLSKILSERITALINVPLLKDHGAAGITCALKNHYGSFDNPGPYHGNNCDPAIAELNAIPAIKDKTRLVILDAIRGTANGGPGCNPQFVWEAKSLLFSTDPVALDNQAWQMIEDRRKVIGLKTLQEEGRMPKWIQTSASMGLGVNEAAKMNVIRKSIG